VLDTANSITWFLMDALWMGKHLSWAYALAPVVFFSGMAICMLEKRLTHLFINLAVLSWITMNISWMVIESDPLFLSPNVPNIFLALGLLFIGAAAASSNDLRDTFSHFRRFRAKRWPFGAGTQTDTLR